ncbi:unnamed protein product [Protopolystoma xenopodis]|uniref:Uncharacterized protein n=1 Tax=Protopolystoma xenopodis TaxID=117903 RepID=A0A3S5AH91_9PLAT|nr:unnamed protein product [Protopolystoma xenopodis]
MDTERSGMVERINLTGHTIDWSAMKRLASYGVSIRKRRIRETVEILFLRNLVNMRLEERIVSDNFPYCLARLEIQRKHQKEDAWTQNNCSIAVRDFTRERLMTDKGLDGTVNMKDEERAFCESGEKREVPAAMTWDGHRALKNGSQCGDSASVVISLNPSTYDRLVLSAPMGQRLLIICVTSSNSGKRLSESDTGIIQASLCLDFYSGWLAALLRMATGLSVGATTSHSPLKSSSTSCGRDDVDHATFGNFLRPSNCMGTVIALNSYRRYFSLYHPLLPGSKSTGHGKFVSSFPQFNLALVIY